ncbi:sensor histidine kinase [Clostridium neuense]|uniref:histidine kinase n=1 Tax=Clostridium neuense TaxID=1728934 RepID=A0ABW8TID2_9CLOT
MEILIIIIIVVLLILFVALYTFLNKEIGNIANMLKEINNTETNLKVLMSSSSKNLKSLVLEINKSLDEKIETKVQYKKMNSDMKESIANISHDLRTPLTSIIGYMQLIEDDNLSDSEKKEYIEIVKKRAKNLQGLIENFYDLSRLESYEYKFKAESIDLSKVLCDILASFYNDFLKAGIEPSIEIDKKLPEITADENAVKRVISNLTLNIIRHAKKSTKISLKNHGDFVIMSFKNAAPDLKKEDCEHLFDRFFMADRTRNGNNTGLGLTITKELVEQMGNSIYAELIDGNLSIIIKWKI